MIRRFDFRCTECSSVSEHWIDDKKHQSTCLECGGVSRRIISPVPTQFKGFGFPGFDDKWARDHEKSAKK